MHHLNCHVIWFKKLCQLLFENFFFFSLLLEKSLKNRLFGEIARLHEFGIRFFHDTFKGLSRT